MKTPAFSYLRVSGKGQLEGDGFTRQREAIKRFAAANNLQIDREYAERGQSGTIEGMDRPAWIEMIAAIMGDGVQTILIERLDRLARDLMVQEHIIADLRRRRITLISTAEPDLCQDDPTRKLLRQIMGAIAEYDKAMTVSKLRGARQRQRTASGRCEGAKPFGDDTHPGEADILARMKALQAEGRTLGGIAKQLNELGLATRHQGTWHARSVARILRR
jgi:DNA invertase Pin-like site-specific DNA recombinase